MVDPAATFDEPPEPDISHLVIEDDEPVDNMYSERQQSLLTECLYTSWNPGRPFVALANVGMFYALKKPAYVPDFLLSVDVTPPPDLRQKKNLTYLVWEFGKRPDLVVEVVSNIDRHEERKLVGYAEVGIPYYVIHDPSHHLSDRTLRAYQLHGASYVELLQPWFEELGLGLALWEGDYRDSHDIWLRWRTLDGELLPTALESLDSAKQSADDEKRRAEEAEERVRQLEERLRQQGL